jgi:hypothetical protein
MPSPAPDPFATFTTMTGNEGEFVAARLDIEGGER